MTGFPRARKAPKPVPKTEESARFFGAARLSGGREMAGRGLSFRHEKRRSPGKRRRRRRGRIGDALRAKSRQEIARRTGEGGGSKCASSRAWFGGRFRGGVFHFRFCPKKCLLGHLFIGILCKIRTVAQYRKSGQAALLICVSRKGVVRGLSCPRVCMFRGKIHLDFGGPSCFSGRAFRFGKGARRGMRRTRRARKDRSGKR